MQNAEQAVQYALWQSIKDLKSLKDWRQWCDEIQSFCSLKPYMKDVIEYTFAPDEPAEQIYDEVGLDNERLELWNKAMPELTMYLQGKIHNSIKQGLLDWSTRTLMESPEGSLQGKETLGVS